MVIQGMTCEHGGNALIFSVIWEFKGPSVLEQFIIGQAFFKFTHRWSTRRSGTVNC